MKTTKVAMRRPHSAGQRAVILADGNVAIFAGRRWGKTEAGVLRILRGVTAVPGLYWWVGLSWRSASLKRAWRLLCRQCERVAVALGDAKLVEVREAAKEIVLPNGSEIWARTAERPESLAGEAVRGAVVDEFSLMPERVWSEYLQATLLDYNGWAMFAGVPKGENWSSHLWRSAGTRPNWSQFHFTTYDNPTIDKAAIDVIRQEVVATLFEQEYLARIVSGAGAVFRNVRACIVADWRDAPEYEDFVDRNGMPARRRHEYVFGIDWGKYEDFTVVAVLDVWRRHFVHFLRINKIDWSSQLDRIVDLARVFRPTTVYAESNAMGDPLIEALARRAGTAFADATEDQVDATDDRIGFAVEPFFTTATTKRDMIEALALAFEQETVGIPADDNVCLELEVMSVVRAGMTVKYAAPAGFHDDVPMSMAIAWQAVAHARPIFL